MSSSWTTRRLTQIDQHIGVLAMNRPEQRNAINVAVANELEACLSGLQGELDLRVLILTGEGGAFGR